MLAISKEREEEKLKYGNEAREIRKQIKENEDSINTCNRDQNKNEWKMNEKKSRNKASKWLHLIITMNLF